MYTIIPAVRRALINRDFALLWAGGALSVLGDYIFEVTLVLWIATVLARGEPWAPLAVTGVLVASALPTLALGPLAGVFVDRWDKRRTLIGANALSALLVLALLPATGSLPVAPDERLPLAWRLGILYGVVLLASTCAQFLRPASAVLLGDIVQAEEQPRAASLNQTSASVGMLLGPPLAAPLLVAFGAQLALLINAGSFLAALVAALAIRAPVDETGPASTSARDLLRDLVAGLRFFARSRTLVAVAASLMILLLGAGAMNTLDVFFLTENLRAPAESFGLLGAAQGAGMILGALLAGALAGRLGTERLLWGSLLVLGALTLAYARLTSLGPALAVLFAIGLAIPGISVAITPIMLRATPREFRGRVSGTLNPLGNAAMIAGMLLGGLLYGGGFRDFRATLLGIRLGPLDTIFTAVGLLCLLGGLYAMKNLPGQVAHRLP